MANTLFGRDRFEREMNEELRMHLEMQVEANIAKGMTPDEARRQANIDFGSLDSVREEARMTRSMAWFDEFRRDLRIAVRGLWAEPWFTAVCVFILALAIGANTTVFSIVSATFLRNLPYPEPDRIVQAWEFENGKFNERGTVNYLNFKDWRQRQDSFSQLAMCLDDGLTMNNGTRSAQVQCCYITEGYLDLLGVKPALGRDFTPKDDQAGAPGVAILTARTWRDQFNADRDIIGKFVQVDDRMVEVVGVLPETFRHYRGVDVFMPLEPRAESLYLLSRNNRRGNTVLGRLMPGVDIATARAQQKSIYTSLAHDYPENEVLSADMAPMQDEMSRDAKDRVFLLYGAVALFLLTACVNLANMFLARGMARTREMAIRAALGATRRQLARQLLVESLLISVIGGVLGIVVAWQASSVVGQLIPWEIRETLGGASPFDWRVCFFALLLTFGAGLLFGLVPALHLSHTRPSGAMKENGGAPGRRGRFSGSDMLAIVQVALVAVLLVSSGLLVRSLQRVLDTPPGINPERLITFQLAGQSVNAFHRDPNATTRFYLNTLEQLRQMQGVEDATYGSSLPYTWYNSFMGIYRDDRPVPETAQSLSFSYHVVGPDFFRIMGIPLQKGRVFSDVEPMFEYPKGIEVSSENLDKIFGNYFVDCVVSRRMAETVWPGEEPLGKRFHIGPPGMSAGIAVVVGVVGNTHQTGAEQGETAEFYVPFRALPIPGSIFFMIKTHSDPTVMMRAMQEKLGELLPNNPVHNMHLMEERMSWFVADRKLTVQMLGAFALASLLLAAAGIYGVIAYITARRTKEVAIRLTLGSTRIGVLIEMLRHGALLLGVGMGIGFVASLFVQKLIRSQLYGVSGTDAVTFIVGAFILAAVGLLACWVPAWRASRVDPMTVLRSN